MLETKLEQEVKDLNSKIDPIVERMASGDIALHDDIILTHWGSAMLQLSVSDLDSIDRVVAISQWASLAFSEKARRDQAKCFLCKSTKNSRF